MDFDLKSIFPNNIESIFVFVVYTAPLDFSLFDQIKLYTMNFILTGAFTFYFLFSTILSSSYEINTINTTTSDDYLEYTYVPELDLRSYDGFWYEVYKDLFDETFQLGGSCVTANYTILDDGTVGVVNTEIFPNGTEGIIDGCAFYEDGNTGGELTVKLDGVPMAAPYWVIELGPIVDEQYDYAVVSDNVKISLFVLARDVDRFFQEYDENVLNNLDKMGFTKKINSPMKTNQTGC